MQGSSTNRWRALRALPVLAGLAVFLLSFSAHAQLSGAYSIGSGGSYATFTAAVSALTSNGVSGPVTFNVLAGTYNETFTIPAITGASATNTITFNGGTGNAATRIITYAVTSSYGSVITLNGANYVRFRNLTVNSTGTSYGYGFLFTNSADYNEITDCMINLPVNTTSAYHIGICASTTSSYSTTGDHGNFNLIQNNAITSGYYGIRWNGYSTSDYTTAQGNQFIGNTMTDWYYYGMYLYYPGGAPVVRGNTSVQRTVGNTTTSGYAYYITYANNGPEISYNYGYSRNYAFYPYYINNYRASTANRAKIFNNMGVVDGTGTVYGMYLYYGQYYDCAYNSIYVKTSSTSSSAYGLYPYSASSAYQNRVMNNSIMVEGGGTQYLVYQPTTTAFIQFDHNLYYSIGGTSQYWYWGSSYTSFALMQAGTSGAHDNSVYGDPEWYSAIDLRSTSNIGAAAGTPVTGITDDFDGETRSSTAPCIGADEYVIANMAYGSSTVTQPNTGTAYSGFANQDIIRVEVTTTGTENAIYATSFTFNTTGTTNPANITAAKVFYTGRYTTFSTGTQFGSAVANPNGTFTVTGSQALAGPGKNYFWLAYDVAASAPSGNYLDGQCTSVTVAGTAYTPTVTNPAGNRQLLQPMNGIYTINPTGSGSRNFTSFAAAITALNTYGVNAPTTFEVAAATYNEQITIDPIVGASAANPVTFDGGAGNAASRIISYSVPTSYQSVVTLNGADYIRFRNLTINSTNTTYGYCMLFTAQADYNEVTNCVLNVPSNTTSSYHHPLVASSTTSYSSSGNWANYNLIQDNELNNGYYGMSWWGSGSSNYMENRGNQFIGNKFQNWYSYGVYAYYHQASVFHKNRVTQRTTGSITGGTALMFYYWGDGCEITSNYTWSNYRASYFYYINYYQQATTNRVKIVNNMFVVDGTNYSTTYYGLYPYYPRYADIAYNSVLTIHPTGTSYGIYHNNTSGSYDVRYANNYIAHEGNGTWYPVYASTVNSISLYDHNAYNRTGTGTDQYYWDGVYYTSLAAFQAGTTSIDDNAVWGNPYYFSNTDLHSNSHVGYQAGMMYAGITEDFDGDSRGTSPCIGADEYPAPPPENDLGIADVMINTADTKWAHVEGVATHSVLAVLENTGLSANPATVSITYKIGSAPANEFDGVQQTVSPAWVGKKALVEFSNKLTGLTAGSNVTVYVRVFWAQDENPANNTVSDNALIQIEKVHGLEGFEKMDAGLYPFTRHPNFLDLPWMRIDNNGGATLEVTPGTGVGGTAALAMNAPTEAADEWIITPAADLLLAASYRFGFDFRNWGGSPVTIQLAWGTSPDPSQMAVFATFADIAPGSFLTAKQLGGGFDPYFNTPISGSQTYFVGLRFTTSAANAYFSIDNLKLDDNPSPPPKIAFGLPGEPLSTFIDSPFSKITLLANYKQPGVINRTYEVQNKINIYGIMGDFLWDVETSTPWITLTKETPMPTLQNYNLTPPRPRQFQTFTMTVNPAGLAPGTHLGDITFYGILFNDDFPPPASGLVATNEPLVVPVELIISQAGSKIPSSLTRTISTPLTVPGSPYHFTDVNTGEPIATVEVTSGQIDVMTITAYPNQLPMNLQRMLFVRRYWQIKHTSAAWWTANITFPYADGEAAMITDRLQLRGVRQPVMLGAWENPIMGTSSVSDPMTNAVTVHDFNPTNIGGNIALAQPYMIYGKDAAATPMAFGLEQNYPNPFNPTTSIVFTVGEERAVRVAVYDLLGTEMAELVNETLPAGRYEVTFDASDLPSGTYVYRMQAGDFVFTQRMTLSK